MAKKRDERHSHIFGVRPKGPAISMPEPAVSGPRYPDFVYHGGPVINAPQLYIVFVGDWSSRANQTRAANLSQFVADLLSSSYMNILSQYVFIPPVYRTTGNVLGSVFVTTPNNNLSAADIHNILKTLHWPEPTPSTAYILYLDDNIAVNDTTDGIEMCESTNDNAFGFHHFFTTTAGNVCPFAVVPGLNDACLTNSCPDPPGGPRGSGDAQCSLHLAQTQEERQTQETSHELSEMFSDPQVNAWYSATADENGDICNGQYGTITVNGRTLQVYFLMTIQSQ
jgi:hypothetical protein